MKKILLMIPLLLSVAYALPNDAGTLRMNYTAQSNITIEHLTPTAEVNNLTQEVYLYAQNVDYVDTDFNDFSIIDTEQGSYLEFVHEGDADLLKWRLSAEVLRDRTIMRLNEIPPFPLDTESLPEEINVFLEYGEYIDVNQEIIDTANEVVEGAGNYLDAVLKLADWVNNNIEYTKTSEYLNDAKIATYVFETRKGVCDEFSVLFMSMARSVGIPVRYSYGYAFSNDIDGFGPHAWVEVWLPGDKWMPIDITYSQYGWLDPSHIKMFGGANLTRKFISTYYTADVNELSNLNINNQLPDYLRSALNTKAEGFISVIEETPEVITFTGEVNFSKDEIGEEDYLLMTIRVYNPTDYYIPLSYNLITTSEMIFVQGGRINSIILKPSNYTTSYIIFKTPVIGNSVSHPVSVKMPGMEELSTQINVNPSITQKTSLQEIELQIASQEIDGVTDLRVKDITLSPEISYNGNTQLKFRIRNLGNQVLENVSINIISSLIDAINLTVPRININEAVNITRNLTSSEYGEATISVYAQAGNFTIVNSSSIIFAQKPEIKLAYEGETSFKSSDDFLFKVLLNKINDVPITKLDLTIKTDSWNTTRTYRSIISNITVNVDLPINVISFGENIVSFTAVYEDEYKTTFTESFNKTISKQGEWWELMINSIIKFFNKAVSFFTNLIK